VTGTWSGKQGGVYVALTLNGYFPKSRLVHSVAGLNFSAALDVIGTERNRSAAINATLFMEVFSVLFHSIDD